MRKDRQTGLGLISTLLVFSLIAAFLAAVGLVLNQERQRVRDSHRMADMIRVQFAFETLYRERASYAEGAKGCNRVGALVSACELSAYLPKIGNVKDPGKHAYQIERVPDDQDYGVSFVLERGYGSLAKGKHVLTKDGMR